MGYCLGNDGYDFFWLDTDADLYTLPEDAPKGALAISITSGKKWVKNSEEEWAPLGG